MTYSDALLHRLRAITASKSQPAIIRYGLATVVIAAVAVAQRALFGASAPWFLYTPAVVLVTLFLRGGAGIWATALSALGAGYVVIRPDHPFWLAPVHWAASLIFVLTTLGLVGLLQALRIALLDADALRAARDRDLVETREREAFLSGVLASSTDCIKVLDLDGRLTFMSEGGQKVMEVEDFSAIASCPWPDFWEGDGNAEARAAIAAARAGESRSFVGRAATLMGTPKWWSVAVSPVLGADGRPERILSISRDVTEARRNEEDLRLLAERLATEQGALRAVFQNAPVGLSLAGASGASVLINDQMRQMLGRDISQGGIERYLGAGAIHADGSPYDLAEYPQVNAVRHGVAATAEPFLIKRPDGTRLRTEISSAPLRDGDGVVTGAVSVVVDVEERERAIEHQAVLTGELAHRMKNTMAMVQAIVHQSLRSAGTLAEARENVVSRFEALVRAQDLLTRADWKRTDLGDVTRAALETVDHDGRCSIEGPPFDIGARAALSFTLVLHELATNAIKYGALSVPEGRIAVRWGLEGGAAGLRLAFGWTETGGPPVSPPSRKGFGTRLIDTLGRTFGGRSTIGYDSAGLSWLVEADADRLAAM